MFRIRKRRNECQKRDFSSQIVLGKEKTKLINENFGFLMISFSSTLQIRCGRRKPKELILELLQEILKMCTVQ